MLVTTTFEVDGLRVTEYKGIVRGIVVRSPTIMQGFFASLKNIIGGNIGSYTAMCETARSQAYDLMVQHALQLGANAILGMRYDAADVSGRFSTTEVLCYGTAVVLVARQ
ncbi:MAG: hypothetical protein ACD_45C00569G0003 [uncultured bacterium]|nr:MAG: hypothetical protein ACD_45C00569G0003 [uncultured bacterium]